MSNAVEQMTPYRLARWSLQMLGLDPLLAGLVRAELRKRRMAKMKKDRQLRSSAKRREVNLRKRAAAKAEPGRNLRNVVGPVAGAAAAGAAAGGAAAAGAVAAGGAVAGGLVNRGPDEAPSAASSSSASAAAAAPNLVPMAAAAGVELDLSEKWPDSMFSSSDSEEDSSSDGVDY